MKGKRPAGVIQFRFFLYDHFGGRKLFPRTESLNLDDAHEGAPLQDEYRKVYEYSDCWIEGSRLVVLNARDAQNRGADTFARTKVTSARQKNGHWQVTLQNTAMQTTQVVSA